MTDLKPKSHRLIEIEDRWGANNYAPLDVVVEHASGAFVFDEDGNRYLDCLSAYSAVNQGHCHPRIMQAMVEQLQRVTLTSRAFRNDQLPLFCKEVAELCRMERVLPMCTGAEAVETSIKAARRWGYTKKGIPDGQAEIIVCEQNFHGRTITVVGFSSEQEYRRSFGPFTPGFKAIPFGSTAALEAAITPNTCAFLFEPIQCEAGVAIPPPGFLAKAIEICRRHRVLSIADEIQTGLGRVGEMFACWRESAQPDIFILGKALSGGTYPVSAIVSTGEVIDVFDPGSHGSTFGGNPLGCAVAREAIRVIVDEDLPARSRELGSRLLSGLRAIESPVVNEVRGMGLLVGVDLKVPARPYCERLMELGILCKETHGNIIRIAPPLVCTQENIDWALDKFAVVLS